MIASIKGQVIHKGDRYAIIETGGLGYKVMITPDLLQALALQSETKLWLHQVVREDALELYGFREREELELFQSLIGVSGVGPRSALAVLALAQPATLKGAIVAGNLEYLTKVSGIGRKIAEKIIIELRDKLDHLAGDNDDAGMEQETEVLEALKAIGYREQEARRALQQLSNVEGETTGEKVKAALKILNK